VLIPHFLRLRVGQGESELVDHLRPKGDGFFPAVGTGVVEDFLPEGVAEGGLYQLRPDAAVAFAEDFTFAYLGGLGIGELRDRRAQVGKNLHHFVLGHHVAATMGDVNAFSQRRNGVVAMTGFDLRVAEQLIGFGDVGIERDDALERLGGLGGVAGFEQCFAEGKMGDFVVRAGVGAGS
jgi:hypothetical protein